MTRAAIESVADMLGMAYIRVLEVATFYTQFQLQPVGTRAHVQVCGTTPCMLRGAEDLIQGLQEEDRQRTFHPQRGRHAFLGRVECQGACVNAPMVHDLQGHVRGSDAGAVSRDHRQLRGRQGSGSRAGSADRPHLFRADRRPDDAAGAGRREEEIVRQVEGRTGGELPPSNAAKPSTATTLPIRP
ncbi:hypothetical protein F2981_12390 [Sinorhizobium meliloti]|nr:hypothetical protein [Sinorhizobium meliloti]